MFILGIPINLCWVNKTSSYKHFKARSINQSIHQSIPLSKRVKLKLTCFGFAIFPQKQLDFSKKFTRAEPCYRVVVYEKKWVIFSNSGSNWRATLVSGPSRSQFLLSFVFNGRLREFSTSDSVSWFCGESLSAAAGEGKIMETDLMTSSGLLPGLPPTTKRWRVDLSTT